MARKHRLKQVIRDPRKVRCVETMLSTHAKYRKAAHKQTPSAAYIRTAVETSVMSLTFLFVDGDPEQDVPHVASRAYRAAIAATKGSGQARSMSHTDKKRVRDAAFAALEATLIGLVEI